MKKKMLIGAILAILGLVFFFLGWGNIPLLFFGLALMIAGGVLFWWGYHQWAWRKMKELFRR